MLKDHQAAETEAAVTPAEPTQTASKASDRDRQSQGAAGMSELVMTITKLRVDERRLRLENEDLRFERDRYKASAAKLQERLTAALNEFDSWHLRREELDDLRREVVSIAREFEVRLAGERQSADDEIRKLQAEIERCNASDAEPVDRSTGALNTFDGWRLDSEAWGDVRREFVSIAREFEGRLTREKQCATDEIQALRAEIETLKQGRDSGPRRWRLPRNGRDLFRRTLGDQR